MNVKKSLFDLFQQVTKSYPDAKIKTAVPDTDDGESYVEVSFGELYTMATKLSFQLREFGIEKGDKVAIIGKPHPRWAAIFFAVQQLGAICVPIDVGLTAQEVRRILHESEAKLVAVQGDRQEVVASNLSLLPRLEGGLVYTGEAGDHFLQWDNFVGEQSLEKNPSSDPDETATIMYTSGTTGDAKGVMLTHRNLISNLIDMDKMLDIDKSDKIASILPWHHIYGLTTHLLLPLNFGASILYTHDYRNLPQILKSNKATFLLGVPKLFNAIYKEITHEINSSWLGRWLYKINPRLLKWKVKRDFAGSQFRFAVSGGAPLDPETAKGFRELGLAILEGYGLTETSPILTMTEDPFTTKEGTVGKPLPSVEIKLQDTGDEVKEVLVRGPNIMKGYYKNESRTKEVLDEDGWFHTGDSGRLDEDNWLYLNGRKKNVIVLESGKNVYPEEVEWELSRLPFVEEVLVHERERSGRPVVAASIYPDYERLEEEGIEEKEEVEQVLWDLIKEDCENLARYKRIKSKRDLRVMDEPFEKTPTLKVKRYLYKDSKVAEK